MLGKFRNKIKQENSHVFTLQMALAGSFVIIVFLMLLYRNALSEQLFRVPPDLRQGAVMRANDVAAPTVYSYTYYIMQQLNNWPKSGDVDFADRIYYLQAFLTPSFREDMTNELEKKSSKGELRLRVRKIQEIVGHNYTEERVKIESDNSWVVWLDVEITETVYGKPVKTVYVRYPIRVVRYDVDPEQNPWGLAISEYASQPLKLSEDDLKIPFKRPM
jgi:integrating conjugative element protein (TIGR03746 family)